MDKLTVFIALTGIAVLLQAGVLMAMYFTMRKSGERMEALASEVKTKVMPTVEQAQQMLTEMRPKLEGIVDNLEGATTVIRSQIQRVDATVTDAMDRARLQIIRGDELLTRTMDRVEQTSDIVQKTVVSPVRQLSGLMQGITVGLEFLFGGRNRRNGGSREERRPVPQDEMFI
jgi:methyl-accepting chemotaxis protein